MFLVCLLRDKQGCWVLLSVTGRRQRSKRKLGMCRCAAGTTRQLCSRAVRAWAAFLESNLRHENTHNRGKVSLLSSLLNAKGGVTTATAAAVLRQPRGRLLLPPCRLPPPSSCVRREVVHFKVWLGACGGLQAAYEQHPSPCHPTSSGCSLPHVACR